MRRVAVHPDAIVSAKPSTLPVKHNPVYRAKQHRCIATNAQGGGGRGEAGVRVVDKPSAAVAAPQAVPLDAETSQRRPSLTAFAAGLIASGLLCYATLSRVDELPSVPGWLPASLASLPLAFAGSLAIAKLVLQDQFHVNIDGGRMQVQAFVPSAGPPMAPGSVEVRYTGDPVMGNGAYAVKPIAKGSYIISYEGELLDRAAFEARYGNQPADMVMGVGSQWAIDATGLVGDTSTFHAVHMNHSRRRANVVRYTDYANRAVRFFASRDIAPGEQLLHTYSRDYWRGREHMERD